MNNPFDYTPDEDCRQAFRILTKRIQNLKSSSRPEDMNFCREIEAGKMLGVLVASDAHGMRHNLFAFSGQLGDGGFHFPGFVDAVFDYLHPDGYFKQKEADISRQNLIIKEYEQSTLQLLRQEHDRIKQRLETEVSAFREVCRQSKKERDARRKTAACSEEELADMIRRSQFEKAELHRLKKRMAAGLAPFENSLLQAENHLETLRNKRRADSEALQKWLFSNFFLLNARGERKSLGEIFASETMGVPPSGAGECCGPKLLQAAYLKGWTPLSMAEYWYGRPKEGELRIHGSHYPACRGKCRPILGWMLEGLEVSPPLCDDSCISLPHEPQIIHENEFFCVACKPSGMLSVPGKTASVSLQQWLALRYGPDKEVKMAHRLDRDTSGLVIATFGERSFKVMQSLFSTRKVRKTYVAVLEGDHTALGIPQRGHIDLPLSPDYLDRPRQRVDMAHGKPAYTDYEFTGVSQNQSRVLLYPHTGRTHQLRVHAASEAGLGIPIAGDPLYAGHAGISAPRLMLHSWRIEFTFPLDEKHYRLEAECPFCKLRTSTAIQTTHIPNMARPRRISRFHGASI